MNTNDLRTFADAVDAQIEKLRAEIERLNGERIALVKDRNALAAQSEQQAKQIEQAASKSEQQANQHAKQIAELTESVRVHKDARIASDAELKAIRAKFDPEIKAEELASKAARLKQLQTESARLQAELNPVSILNVGEFPITIESEGGLIETVNSGESIQVAPPTE